MRPLPVTFVLLQIRNPDDPMRQHEVEAFARVLQVAPESVRVIDLLTTSLTPAHLTQGDVFLLGGAGEYSAAGEGEWLDRALDSLRLIHATRKPTFASCWGFQAMARAMGGKVIHDIARMEVGTHRLYLTDAGTHDPIFSPLAPSFLGQMGHEDHVVELPANTTLLAYSDKVSHQAYCFTDAPIYCTQFHPELNREDLQQRLEAYPDYMLKVAKILKAHSATWVQDTTPSEGILRRFVERYFPQ